MQPLRSNSGTIAFLALGAALILAAQGVAANSTLPVYPGAATVPVPTNLKNFSMCGHKVAFVSYESPAGGKSVAKWYASKVPGAIVVDLSRTDPSSVDTEIEVFTPDASQAAVIHQMTLTNAKLQAAAKTIDADKTGIGLQTYDPPLGADYVTLVQQAKRGDVAAKRALAAKCPQG
jgi:hypothetical protein